MASDLIRQVEDAAIVLESGAASDEDLIRAYDALGLLGAKVADMRRKIAEAAIAYLGDRRVKNGGIEYYVGKKTTKKCVDAAGAARALLEIGGVDTLTRCLSTQAFKPAAAMKELGDSPYFRVETSDELVVKKLNLELTGKESDDGE